jgi:hypothetical protein
MCIEQKFFTSNQKLLENLICSIGLGVIDDPIELRCKNGSHIFCNDCLSKHLKISNKCPICQDVANSIPSLTLRKIIDTLEYCCPCGWKDVYENYKKHTQECPDAIINCPYDVLGCEIKLKRTDLMNHLNETNYHHKEFMDKKGKDKDNNKNKMDLVEKKKQEIIIKEECLMSITKTIKLGDVKLYVLLAIDYPNSAGILVGEKPMVFDNATSKMCVFLSTDVTKFVSMNIKGTISCQNSSTNIDFKFDSKNTGWKQPFGDHHIRSITFTINDVVVNYK